MPSLLAPTWPATTRYCGEVVMLPERLASTTARTSAAVDATITQPSSTAYDGPSSEAVTLGMAIVEMITP